MHNSACAATPTITVNTDGSYEAHVKGAYRPARLQSLLYERPYFLYGWCLFDVYRLTRMYATAAHHVMAPGFEHQSGPDPIIFGREVSLAFHHTVAVKKWFSSGNEANGVATGMSVDKEAGFFHSSFRLTAVEGFLCGNSPNALKKACFQRRQKFLIDFYRKLGLFWTD